MLSGYVHVDRLEGRFTLLGVNRNGWHGVEGVQDRICGHVCEFTGRTKVGSWFIWLMAVFGFGDTQTPDMLVGTSSQLSLVVEVRLWSWGVSRVVPHFDNHTLVADPFSWMTTQHHIVHGLLLNICK